MHRITDDCYEFVGSPGSILKVIVLIVEVRFGESAVLSVDNSIRLATLEHSLSLGIFDLNSVLRL
jgi:hypothetical protein